MNTSLSSDGALDISVGNTELKGYVSKDTNLIILRSENANELGHILQLKSLKFQFQFL